MKNNKQEGKLKRGKYLTDKISRNLSMNSLTITLNGLAVQESLSTKR